MSATEPAPPSPPPPTPPTLTPPNTENLISRIQGILLRPKTELPVIEAEATTTPQLFVGYAAILAAIPAIAGIIGGFFPQCSWFGVVCYRTPLVALVVGEVVKYILGLVAVFATALIANELAPSFGGQKNGLKAQKLAVYSCTAAWLAGIFAIYPALRPLGLAGAYGIFILYLGAPTMMKTAHDKAIGYVAVISVIGIVLWGVAQGIGGGIESTSTLFIGPGVASNSVTGNVHIGNANVDLGQLSQAARQAQAASQALQANVNGQPAPQGTVQAVAADALKALLPGSVAGLPRTDIESTSGSVAGMSGSNAEATYTAGDKNVHLTVTDMAAAGAFASMASAMNVTSDKETATGYEKVGKVDGRMTTEEWDRQSNSGKYSVLVANRFLVDATGSGVGMSIDDLKAAVNAVGFGRLEGMAHG